MAEKDIDRLGGVGRRRDRDVRAIFLLDDLEIEKDAASLFGTNEIADFAEGVGFVDQMQRQRRRVGGD